MKRKKKHISRFFLFFLLITFLFPCTAVSENSSDSLPANPNASEDARKVLAWISNLPNKTENKVISGQNIIATEVENSARGYRDNVEYLADPARVGKYIALVGIDYGYDNPLEDIKIGNQTVIEHWNDGGLVTIHQHVNNPWTGERCQDLRGRDFDELINPTTEYNRQAHDRWMASLDKAAAGLAELRDAGVVVLWRPFHEMTLTSTFWWAVQRNNPASNESFKKMWIHMFRYFTEEKGLNNLLWVYSTGNSDTYNPVDGPYPGDQYVDIVGIDVYNENGVEIRGEGYETMLRLGKPFAITEFGGINLNNPTPGFIYDNMTTIRTIRERYPKTSYFYNWQSFSGHNVAIRDNANAAGLLNDPWVITRDEVDWESGPVLPPEDGAKPGDLNGDSEVDIEDLIIVATQWGRDDSPGDADGDGTVNIEDLLIVVKNWGS